MSKIEECYTLFRQYCKQELLYFAVIQFFDDESGDIVDDDTNEYLISFDNFEDCINKIKEKIHDSNKKQS
jgi:hypothetical protein